MADNPTFKVSNPSSRAAQQNVLSGSRIGIVFTYPNIPEDATDASITQTAFSDGKDTELLVGAGWRSMSLEQSINVTQEGALGFFDIIETVEHSVSSNTLTVDKMTLRHQLLSNLGIAPWGAELLASPVLNAYIYDVREQQSGIDFGFVKLYGLHLASNRINFNFGQTVMENLSFRVTRVRRVQNKPHAMLKIVKKLYPELYDGKEAATSFTFQNG